MDRQSEAFREATRFGMDMSLCDVYDDGDSRPIRTPEEWEEDGWDAGRETPKTREEAKASLLARIADPFAPDDESVVHAYDDLEA